MMPIWSVLKMKTLQWFQKEVWLYIILWENDVLLTRFITPVYSFLISLRFQALVSSLRQYSVMISL